jgi:hypothetical protein
MEEAYATYIGDCLVGGKRLGCRAESYGRARTPWGGQSPLSALLRMEVTRYAGARFSEQSSVSLSSHCASRSLNSFLLYKPLSCS